MRSVLVELHGKHLRWRLEVTNRVGCTQFEIYLQMTCCLGLISVGAQRNREIRLEILNWDRLVIFDFQPLRSIGRNGDNARAEHRRALGFFRATLTHLEKSGIDRLLLELVI